LTVIALVALALLLWTVWDGAAVAAWKQEARPLPYFAVMCLVTAVGAPVTPFFVVAGATFGVGLGLLGSGLALAGSLIASYWVARGWLRPRLASMLRRYGREFPDLAEPGRKRVRFALTVKLAPAIPAVVKNYVLASAGVPFALYFGLSMLITGAYGAALVLLGDSLFEHDLGRALPGAIVVAVAALGLWLLKRSRGRPNAPGDRRATRRPGSTAARTGDA
jgi:uncharacterized membrane protein YdjX (TVP38/TMEM64 family)